MRMGDKFSEGSKPFRRKSETPRRRGLGSSLGDKPKKAVNVSVDAEVLAVAKELGINLSRVLETELRKLTEDARVEKWSRENKAHIDSYNAYIERNGIFGEEFQDWDDESV